MAEGAIQVAKRVGEFLRGSPQRALENTPRRAGSGDSDESDGFASASETTLIVATPQREREFSPIRERNLNRVLNYTLAENEQQERREMAQPNDELALALLQTIPMFNGERATTLDNWSQQLSSVFDLTRWNDQQKLRVLAS